MEQRGDEADYGGNGHIPNTGLLILSYKLRNKPQLVHFSVCSPNDYRKLFILLDKE